MAEPRPTTRPVKRRSLRWQIFVPINVAVVAFIAAFLVWDSLTEWHVHLDEKQVALRAEAETVLAAVALHRSDPRQRLETFINDACSRAQGEDSPGHHIAVQVGSTTLQARSRYKDPEAMLRSMREAAADPEGTAEAEGGPIVVGSASREGITVWVAEHITDVQRLVQRVVARRIASIILMAGALAIVINLLVNRLVDRPVRAVVDAVRRVRAGQLGVQTAFGKSEELAFLADEFNAMSAGLAAADKERRWQMDKARLIQEHLLPTCGAAGRLPTACLYEPASEVGGDFYDVRVRDDGTVLVCMADVTGHGVPAAMGAATLKILFAAASDRSSDPERILADVSRGFAGVSLDDVFASMFMLVVDDGTPAAGSGSGAGAAKAARSVTLRYASAGHPPAYLLHEGRPPTPLPSTGPLLGIHDIKQWKTVVVDVRPCDRIVMVTDGLMDAASPSGERFGIERLEAAIGRAAAGPLQEIPRRIIHEVRSFCGDRPQEDDMTLLALEL
jgi:phosphoserine phosphatase RsbU/P